MCGNDCRCVVVTAGEGHASGMFQKVEGRDATEEAQPQSALQLQMATVLRLTSPEKERGRHSSQPVSLLHL